LLSRFIDSTKGAPHLSWSSSSASTVINVSSSEMVISVVRGGGNGPIRRGRMYFNASLYSHDPDDPDGKVF